MYTEHAQIHDVNNNNNNNKRYRKRSHKINTVFEYLHIFIILRSERRFQQKHTKHDKCTFWQRNPSSLMLLTLDL